MSDLVVMGEDEWAHARMQARAYNTHKLRGIVDTLTPYVDGSMGMVSPPHTKLYLQALKDMGLMYQLSQPPQLSEPTSDGPGLLAVGMAQRRAIEALEVLESRARSRGLA
jgi:hypothetical protein